MKEALEKRLKSLKQEFESGQKVLAELEAKQTNVRETLLRIAGAIQVIEEMLQEQDAISDNSYAGNSQVQESLNISSKQP